MICVCGCGQPAAQLHHVVYQQAIRRAARSKQQRTEWAMYDGNLVPVALACHEAHHARTRPLPLRVLPNTAFSFARRLMGPGAAYEYLARRYAGTDERLDGLLAEWEAAA